MSTNEKTAHYFKIKQAPHQSFVRILSTGYNMPVSAAKNAALVIVQYTFHSTYSSLLATGKSNALLGRAQIQFWAENNTLTFSSAKIGCLVSKLKLTAACADTYVGDREYGGGLCMT